MRSPALVSEVQKPPELTPDRFESDFVRSGRAVVLRGLVSHWPALRWPFPSIAGHLPKRPVRACGIKTVDATSSYTFEMSTDEIVRRLEEDGPASETTGPDWLLSVLDDMPEILAELPPPPVYRGPIQYRMFLGRNTRTRGHYHTYKHAMICQIHGRKRVVLYPPEDSPSLYPLPVLRETRHYQTSRVDFANPDVDAFPKLGATHPVEAILEPGDALFVPIHWWHAVYGIGKVLSTSLFWDARLRDHAFPHPGIRSLAYRLRWDVLDGVRELAATAKRRLSAARAAL